MVKHSQTIRWLLQTNYLSVFDHFVGLMLKTLSVVRPNKNTFSLQSGGNIWKKAKVLFSNVKLTKLMSTKKRCETGKKLDSQYTLNVTLSKVVTIFNEVYVLVIN